MVLSVSPTLSQESDADKLAFRIREVAVNAQREGNFEIAKDKWQELVDKYPDSNESRSANFNLGLCHYELKAYDSAILAFEKAINTEEESANNPDLLLALGYSRIQEGRRLEDEDAEQSNMQLTSATVNLITILKKHESFEDIDVAAYFCGQAYEDLQNFDEAEKYYRTCVGFERKNDVRIDAMYALGRMSARGLDYEDAALWYEDIRTEVDIEAGHPLLNDTNLNYGDALLSMGVALLTDGNRDAANKRFVRAKEVLVGPASDASFAHRDEAIFLDGSCSMYLGDYVTAANTFEAVSTIEDSELNEKALVLAGSNFLKANDEAKGFELLDKAIDSTSSFAVDAVHEKAIYLMQQNRFKDAWDLTDPWSEKIKDHPLAVEVLLDRANASRELSIEGINTAELYAGIARSFPTHRLAPKCVYWSAFSNYEARQYEKAIEQAKEFEKDYAGDDYLADMQEVQADSLLMIGENAQAESLFRRMVNEFQQDKQKRSWWVTRAGFAAYLQKNYDDAIEWLETRDALVTDPSHKAESLYWIGSSHFENGNYEEALQKLQESLDISQDWRRGHEVMLALCNTQLKQSRFEQAQQTVAAMLEKYVGADSNPEARVSVANALYSVADELLASKQFDAAIENFDALVERTPNSKLVPSAIYRAAYAASEGNRDDAAQRFGDFLERYPKHELAQQAALGKTDALRRSGKTSESIEELQKMIAAETDESSNALLKYQLGLAYVDAQDWKNATSVFKELSTSVDPDNENADKIWYELAWAQREDGDEAGSLESFASLVENHPDSSTAPEAYFLLGNQLYSEKKYDAAIEQFSKANIDSARDEIREKALYKLGWCHYRKNEFDKAGEQFLQQAENYAEGKLHADGRYMVAQCAWRAEKFDIAFEAYTVAKPVVESSDTVSSRIKMLTLLNGAKSGNKTSNYAEAASMARDLLAIADVDATYKQQARLELGLAQKALGNLKEAVAQLDMAKLDKGETGAHAQALLGDILYTEAVEAAKAGDKEGSKSKFKEAIDAYTYLYFGYGGSLATPPVKAWQAYGAYEAARCHMVQINEAEGVDKIMHLGKAIKAFEYFTTRFEDSKLAPEAKKQLKKLLALKKQIGT